MTHLFRFLSVLFVLIAVATPVYAADDTKKEEESGDTLCPDTDVMKKAAPGDISGVQADIERLNLCVERAKLLKQLDDVAVQREKALEKIKNPESSLSTGLGAGGNGIPLLPISQLPPLAGDKPPAALKPGQTHITNAVGNAFDQASLRAPEWQVRKIWGQGPGTRAQIVDSATQTILNVVKGDPLPDGGVVETISVKGVAVSRNGKITDLSWEQITDSSANAKVIP